WPQAAAGCLGAGEPIAIVYGGDKLALVAGEPGKLRRIDMQPVAGLVFAGPIDVDRDGRDEVAVVSRRDVDDARIWRYEIYRLEQGKLVRKLDRDAYTISAHSAQLVGARLQEIDLLLELTSDGESLRAGGLFLHTGAKAPRNLAPLRLGPAHRWRIAEPVAPPTGSDAGVPGDAARPPAGDDGELHRTP
ncbi:MAG TPA: hypothetical protein VL172_21335, partial [Kofleriaceae bacterium]|nr:hypothetical protein [Kofleriaceae bacterium]